MCGYLFSECCNTYEKINSSIIVAEKKIFIPIFKEEKPGKEKESSRILQDDFNSKKFYISYYGKGEERYKRYGVSNKELHFDEKFLSWKGGQKISKVELEKLCRQVFKKLPHIKTSDETVALVVETAIAESDGGKITRGMGQDRGVFQIRISAAKDQLNWLKKNHKDIFEAINNFRNPKLSEEDNLLQNVPYALAMCITHYWRNAGSQYYKHISSLTDRAIMWKSTYNTKKGLGTVNNYINRVTKYTVKRG